MSLAGALENLGRLEESLEMSEAAHTRLTELAGEAHPQTLIARNNMAMLFIKLGRAPEAVEICEEVLALSTEHDPTSRINAFPFRSNLGRAMLAAKDFEGAEAALLEVERTLGEDDEAPPRDIARVRALLAELYEAWGKPDEAESWKDE